MNRKLVIVIVLGVVFLSSLLSGGLLGFKALRRVRQRQVAMTAYHNRQYDAAEPLLLEYVSRDPNSEEAFVALANIYRASGNAEMEAQMWHQAATLDPHNAEYLANMLDCAVKSASYTLLHGILGRKAGVDEKFTDRELYLFVISSFRSGYSKDGEITYAKYSEADPEVFHKDELGRMAEFMATYDSWTDGERDAYLNQAVQSEDPAIRFEALYFAIRRLEQSSGGDPGADDEMERLLKRAAEANYIAGTALLADFYFSKCRFEEAADVLAPYLKTLDDLDLYLLYAESCAFTGRLDELKSLAGKLRTKSGSLPMLADYCVILSAYLEDDPAGLALAVRAGGKRIDSPLARFIRLRVAMASGSFDEIRKLDEELFANPPFSDLHNRAMYVSMDYLSREMRKPENRKEPARMAELAAILSPHLNENRLLTEVILMDRFLKEMANADSLTKALDRFPDDALLLPITAEFLVFDGKAEQALPLLEQFITAEKTAGRTPDLGIRTLRMLALDQLGRSDEAAGEFREIVGLSGYGKTLLSEYFLFCAENRRRVDLEAMADELAGAGGGKLEPYAACFRAAALLLSEDASRVDEAMVLFASAPDDAPDIAFYAANALYRHGRLDDAEAKYQAILTTYRTPSLPYVNLSDLCHEKGDEKKALDAANKAFELDKESMLPAFTYAKRLAEAGRYTDAVETLDFPRHEVDFRPDIVAFWRDCMCHVVEKCLAERKFLLAESHCRQMLMIVPDDEFATENLEKIHDILFPKQDKDQTAAQE